MHIQYSLRSRLRSCCVQYTNTMVKRLAQKVQKACIFFCNYILEQFSMSQIHITNLPSSRCCYCQAYKEHGEHVQRCSISLISKHYSLVALSCQKVLQVVLRLVRLSNHNYRPIVMVLMFAGPLAFGRFTNNQLQPYTFSKFSHHTDYIPLINLYPSSSLHSISMRIF